MTQSDSIAAAYLEETRRSFRGYKRLADDALIQISGTDFFYTPDPESNSIALIVKHIAGNLRSRWTNFLTTDGEKPDRDRDQEFLIGPDDSREELMRRWETGWSTVFDTLQGLGPEDLNRTVYIRRQPHTVLQAINRSVTHCAYHVGQILYLGKHLRRSEWKSLSIPKGKSAEFNAAKPEDSKLKSPTRGEN